MLCSTKKAATLGAGKAMWNSVHVLDLAHCYMILMSAVLQRSGAERAALEGLYFCENGEEFTWGDLSRKIADVLVEERVLEKYDELGRLSDAEMKEHMFGEITWCDTGWSPGCVQRELS